MIYGLLAGAGLAACTAYTHKLACTASELLADAWGTDFTTPREMIGAMVTVPLPLSAGTLEEDAARLRLALLAEDQIEVQLHAWRGRLWVRVSAQVYNDVSDIERLAQTVARRWMLPDRSACSAKWRGWSRFSQ